MDAINRNDVKQVYSGKSGKCCCGCSGKHLYAKRFQHAGSVSRGYTVDDEDVNDRMVTRVINIINKNIAKAELENDYVFVDVDGRLYCAYFADEMDKMLARKPTEIVDSTLHYLWLAKDATTDLGRKMACEDAITAVHVGISMATIQN